jgi:hypothetical protein
MTEWKQGDIALCVIKHPKYPKEVSTGSIHIVENVWDDCVDADDPSFISAALDLVGIPRMDGDLSYWAGSFRKISPGHEIKGSEVDQRNPWKLKHNV